jgi:hypothetical protein
MAHPSRRVRPTVVGRVIGVLVGAVCAALMVLLVVGASQAATHVRIALAGFASGVVAGGLIARTSTSVQIPSRWATLGLGLAFVPVVRILPSEARVFALSALGAIITGLALFTPSLSVSPE